jgi:dihydrofolate synthase/folylpolyglutamate synthase
MDTSGFKLGDWLDVIENRHAQEIQLGLDRIKSVANELDLLTWDAKVVTVGGTNGKGSTVAALETIYSTAGYQVGAYTSPHLIKFNERIRVNQQPISDELLCAALDHIERCRGQVHLTYFEMVTLAALYFFKQSHLDIIILEVGLGGRLDATNIIDSDLAIITTVDLDHQEYLGSTREAIGYEKAGILRPNRPFIYADDTPPDSLIQFATSLNSPRLEGSFDVTEDSLVIYSLFGPLIRVPLPNINPKAAVAAMLATSYLNSHLPVTPAQLALAMKRIFIPGRQQLIPGEVSILFDVAHNPQAVRLLVEFIRRFEPKGKIHAVFSGLKDKDLAGLIEPMQSLVDFWYPALLTNKRAASSSLLIKVFSLLNHPVTSCYDDPIRAYETALQRAKLGDLIIVYGSFFTVSAVMSSCQMT